MALIITGGGSSSKHDWVWWKDDRIGLTISTSNLDKDLPRWRECIAKTIPGDGGSLPIAELARGTPEVFRHLVAAAHHLPTESNPTFIIKEKLSIEQLRDLAKLTNHHSALHLIARNVPGWVKKLYPPGWHLQTWKMNLRRWDEYMAYDAVKHVYYGSDTSKKAKDPDPGYHGQLEHLWIAYEFGLEKVFNRICFNLAFVAKGTFSNPAFLRPGAFGSTPTNALVFGTADEIYSRRAAYVDTLMARISAHRERLVEAIDSDAPDVSKELCSSYYWGKTCVTAQLRELEKWLAREGLHLKSNGLENSEGRSPMDFLHDSPLETSNVRGEHYTAYCGRYKLVRWMEKDGKAMLLQWLAKFDGKTRIATDEQIQYMRRQRKKYEM
ncbi:hypothetical protein VTJ04DRAFT_1617 [Mycothermus thermophilus]|uniref:uncharacterized protein n=1 Tax=Humicola insolens TaxID=85995 RepID=UPI00374306D5